MLLVTRKRQARLYQWTSYSDSQRATSRAW
jgi:hypothetical protein